MIENSLSAPIFALSKKTTGLRPVLKQAFLFVNAQRRETMRKIKYYENEVNDERENPS